MQTLSDSVEQNGQRLTAVSSKRRARWWVAIALVAIMVDYRLYVS